MFALLAAAALGLLASGLVLGEVFGLRPCHLCNFQRLMYMVFAAFALGGVVLPGWRVVWASLAGLAALGGAATAIQQSWMQHAPQLVNECGFGDPTLVEQVVNWLAERWPAMFMVTGACSNAEWVFLGLSLANWSAVCFLALSLGAGWLLFRRRAG